MTAHQKADCTWSSIHPILADMDSMGSTCKTASWPGGDRCTQGAERALSSSSLACRPVLCMVVSHRMLRTLRRGRGSHVAQLQSGWQHLRRAAYIKLLQDRGPLIELRECGNDHGAAAAAAAAAFRATSQSNNLKSRTLLCDALHAVKSIL